MAHELDFSLGRAAIAYAGDVPWHNFGSKLDPNDDIQTWAEQAGLAWKAREGAVYCRIDGVDRPVLGYKALLRDDTLDTLSIVSTGYKVVQPEQVMQFFGALVKTHGFQMESAGALHNGKRIWALAKINDGAPIVRGDDVIKPYVLLATSFDGSKATTARLTSVRVVCQNTLTYSESDSGRAVRVTHDQQFDASQARIDLGIYADQFERVIVEARRMAQKFVSDSLADSIVTDVFSYVLPKEKTIDEIREYSGYQRVMALFMGGAKGSEMAGQTAWGLLNAFTEHVDHERGYGAERRFGSSLLGAGDRFKRLAHSKIAELV